MWLVEEGVSWSDTAVGLEDRQGKGVSAKTKVQKAKSSSAPPAFVH